MTIKYLYLLAILVLASCDTIYPLQFNGRDVYQYSTECGNIILSGKTFGADDIFIESHGQFSFALDSIRLLEYGKVVPRQNIKFYSNDVLLGDSINQVTSNEKSSLHITIWNEGPLCYSRGKIVLLPSNFIQCKGSAVIQDTIVVTRK